MVNEFRTAMGGGWLGISKKNIFIFKTRQKMLTMLRHFTNLGPFSTFQHFQLSKLCYHFLSSFEKKIIFFISLAILRPLPLGIHWPIHFIKKNWRFCIFSKKKKKWQVSRAPSLHFNFALFFFWKIYRSVNFFSSKIDWSMNFEQRWAGDS